jgi:hypothetical protein
MQANNIFRDNCKILNSFRKLYRHFKLYIRIRLLATNFLSGNFLRAQVGLSTEKINGHA